MHRPALLAVLTIFGLALWPSVPVQALITKSAFNDVDGAPAPAKKKPAPQKKKAYSKPAPAKKSQPQKKKGYYKPAPAKKPAAKPAAPVIIEPEDDDYAAAPASKQGSGPALYSGSSAGSKSSAAKGAKLPVTIGGGDAESNIPGLEGKTSAAPSSKSKPVADEDDSADPSSLTKSNDDDNLAESGLSKAITANGTAKIEPPPANEEMDAGSSKYTRHIWIGLLLLVFLVYHLRGGGRRAVSAVGRKR